jgi:hypothetical protein
MEHTAVGGEKNTRHANNHLQKHFQPHCISACSHFFSTLAGSLAPLPGARLLHWRACAESKVTQIPVPVPIRSNSASGLPPTLGQFGDKHGDNLAIFWDNMGTLRDKRD